MCVKILPVCVLAEFGGSICVSFEIALLMRGTRFHPFQMEFQPPVVLTREDWNAITRHRHVRKGLKAGILVSYHESETDAFGAREGRGNVKGH